MQCSVFNYIMWYVDNDGNDWICSSILVQIGFD